MPPVQALTPAPGPARRQAACASEGISKCPSGARSHRGRGQREGSNSLCPVPNTCSHGRMPLGSGFSCLGVPARDAALDGLYRVATGAVTLMHVCGRGLLGEQEGVRFLRHESMQALLPAAPEQHPLLPKCSPREHLELQPRLFSLRENTLLQSDALTMCVIFCSAGVARPCSNWLRAAFKGKINSYYLRVNLPYKVQTVLILHSSGLR